MGWLQEMQEMCRAFARADGITYDMPKHLCGFAKKVIHLCLLLWKVLESNISSSWDIRRGHLNAQST